MELDDWPGELEAPQYTTNILFSIDAPSYEVPQESLEDTLNDIPAQLPDDQTVTYELLESGSQREKPLLVDNLCYSYTLKVIHSVALEMGGYCQ